MGKAARVRMTGDWDKVDRMIKNLELDLEISAKMSIRRLAQKSEDIVRGHIVNQDLNWRTLSPRYLSSKVSKGYSNKIYMRSSSYFQAITSWTEGYKAMVGVKQNAVDGDGVALANIGRILEYGSAKANIPPRKLWKPSFEEAVKWHIKNNTPETLFLKLVKSKYA